MNYSVLPTFKFTITQMPKENIPIVKNYLMDGNFNLDELADYKP